MATHNQVGKWGENIAVEMLVKKGYAITERNWRSGHYELDIVAMKGDSIVFCEVKTRTNSAFDPYKALTTEKLRRMLHSASAYLKNTGLPFNPRFDAILICGTPEAYTVTHLENMRMPLIRTRSGRL